MADVRFTINGEKHIVNGNMRPTMSLNEYIRESAGLKGTKVMCREAGCGCCAVTVSHCPPDSDKLSTYSVQSCLTPLYAVDGWQISTVEGLGSQRNGFHPIQEKIADFNGTQCGYCTPGMVMNMYGLLHQNPNLTSQDIEDNFDGNMCRCTGYRSILDAMKSFASDSIIPGGRTIDIEDLNRNLCPKTGEACSGTCKPRALGLELQGASWHRPLSTAEVGKLIKANKSKKIRFVFGNTASGIFKDEGPFDVYIDLHGVKEIFGFEVTPTTVKMGGATTLTQYMNILKVHQVKPGFKYFSALYRHIKVVANVMVRNGGCLAGNLMIKKNHHEFPSDLFTTLEGVGASVEIWSVDCSKKKVVSLLDFLLNVDMTNKLITAIILPAIPDNTVFKTFKITPRWQNAHAYINAAFKIPVNGVSIKGRPSIVIGGIDHKTIHAKKTEDYLTNKTLSLPIIKGAYCVLRDELHPEETPLESSAKYRKELAAGLLYKVLLGVDKSKNSKLWSGAEHMHRPISSGLQTYQEKASEFPLKQGMPKKTAPLQASGEAVFVNDMPRFNNEVYGAFVLSDQASAVLGDIDASEALSMQGISNFFSAKDVVGSNNFLPANAFIPFPPHEVFASKEILYAGQPLGIILADSPSLAAEAAKKVKVTYAEIKTPVMSIEESEAAGREFVPRRNTTTKGDAAAAWKEVDNTVEGTVDMGSQYHFFMETHASLAVPSEDGLDLYTACQYSDLAQHAAAGVIGKPLNFVNVTVPRLGGGFGGKFIHANNVSCAATLAAYLSGRPVRLSMDLSSVMKMCGKRPPIKAKYKAGFTKEGDVTVIDIDLAFDCGNSPFASWFMNETIHFTDMAYYVPNWNIIGRPMLTNKATMTPVRAPGSVPAALMIETIMEHVAQAVRKHPIIVKEINLYKKTETETDLEGHSMEHCTIREVWRRLKDVAEVDGRIRQVDAFNKENLWRKRGITMTSCKYKMAFSFIGRKAATVSAFARDGSVVINQDGVEMGQGLYMKVAQGVAHILGVPLDNIKVRPNFSVCSPNSTATGGSVTSEAAMQAAISAAEQLKQRMAPIKEKFPDASWAELCEKCQLMGVDLCSRYLNIVEDGDPNKYFTYCAAVTETEVDVLTGESQVRRVDIMADYGESLNPVIDIGQTEGAYVFGLGTYLTEDTIFDKSGRVLSDGTWNYKPPTTKDIPIDWRIHILPDTPNPSGIRSSKACGEPATGLSVGALFANKLAIQSARKDIFNTDDYIPVVAPFTVERAQQSLGLNENFLVV